MIGFPRRHRASHDPGLETALRASLDRQARQAPDPDEVAERILAAVDRPPAPRPVPAARPSGLRWPAWATPAVAAASVVLVAGVAVVVTRHEGGGTPPVSDRTHGQLAGPTHVKPSPHTPASRSDSQAPASSSATPIDTARLHDVRVVDLTFVGQDDGYALASAHCVIGPGRCTAVLRTHNGRTWHSIGGEAFNVPGVRGCADPCVRNLRFANDRVGYAFGPTALFLTTDGGRDWVSQRGGALALETLDNNVIRVVADGTGCPGPCNVRVETAGIGSPDWTPVHLQSGDVSGAAVSFSRGGSDAYLLARNNPAGGASSATSTLYRSVDDGQSWSAVGEPCPQTGGEADSYAVAAGGDGRVTVLCATRQAPQRWFVTTSADAGGHFTTQHGAIPPDTAGGLLTGDPTTVLVAARDGLSRSADGGASWQRVSTPSGPISFVGFENSQVGRAVSDGGRTIWTTRDGGATWHRVSLG